MIYLNLLMNEFRLQAYELRQYWFETVTGIVLIMGLFVGLFYGVKSMVPGMEEAIPGGSCDLASVGSPAAIPVPAVLHAERLGHQQSLSRCPHAVPI